MAVREYPGEIVTTRLRVDGSRIDVYTPDGSLLYPFKTIQDAIDAATAGTTVVIAPGTYVEDLALKAGVFLKAVFCESLYSVYVHGKVSFSAGGRVDLTGINVLNTADHALEFSGATAQKLCAFNCKFETNSAGAHHALHATNSHANSEIRFTESLLQVLDSSGGAKGINTVGTSAGEIGLQDTTVEVYDDHDNIAVDLQGAIVFWHTQDIIRGTVQVADAATCIISLVAMYSSTQPCVTTNSTAPTVLGSTSLSTTASPAVTGAGVFAYNGVSYPAAGTGLAGTLNGGLGPHAGALPNESAYNTVYTPTIPANWVAPAPTRVQDGLDRIAAAVAGLLGVPIP